MKIIHVDASILDAQSASRQLSRTIVDQLKSDNPDAPVIRLDLALEPFGHLTGAEFMAFQGMEPQDSSIKECVVRNATALDDFINADVVVVGAPMYNFSVPSQLKAWLDRLAVAGKTFKYTEAGPVGLAGGKRVIIASTRGGYYGEGQPTAFLDHQENYLTACFRFFGITDVSVVRAEGLAISPDSRTAAMEAAADEIGKLAA